MLSYSFAIICIAGVSVVLHLHIFFIVLQYFVLQVLVLSYCYVSVMLQVLVLSFKSCVAIFYKHARIMYQIKSKLHNWLFFSSFGKQAVNFDGKVDDFKG